MDDLSIFDRTPLDWEETTGQPAPAEGEDAAAEVEDRHLCPTPRPAEIEPLVAEDAGSELALTPKAYAAPRPATREPTKQELDFLLRAQLTPIPSSQDARRDPRDLEQHVLLTVRPGEQGSDYANRRIIGWMREIEQIGRDAKEDANLELSLKAYGDLARMWQLAQAREAKEKERAHKEQAKGGDLHMHQHVHQHSELPDLSRVPADQLFALADAFAKQAEKPSKSRRARDVTPQTQLDREGEQEQG